MVTDMDGGSGFSVKPLDVNVVLPQQPTIPPGVDLQLSLHRNSFLSFECPNPSDPTDQSYIQLTSDPSTVSGVVDEWEIYRDDDAYTATRHWHQIGSAPTALTQFNNYSTGPNAYNPGATYYYKVTARSIADIPETESSTSTEWAFIEFLDGETSGITQDQHPWIVGYGGTKSAQLGKWKPGQMGAFCKSGYACDPLTPDFPPYTWSVLGTNPIPILADPVLAATTHVWYMELRFGGEVVPNNECWSTGQLLSVGTVPDDRRRITARRHISATMKRRWHLTWRAHRIIRHRTGGSTMTGSTRRRAHTRIVSAGGWTNMHTR